jgi:hypothetical protein
VRAAEVLSRSETRVVTTKDTDEGAGEDGGAGTGRAQNHGAAIVRTAEVVFECEWDGV